MPKSKLEASLAAALKDAQTTVSALQKIRKLAVIHDAPDAMGALSEGCVLLGVSRVDNDQDGDGFRYLPSGVDIAAQQHTKKINVFYCVAVTNEIQMHGLVALTEEAMPA
jgi:hypothetical protein